MTDSTGRLADQVALVTGGANGIGAAIATRFAAEGARVVIGDLDAEGARAAAEKINANGGRAVGAGADVSKREDVERLVDFAVDSFGPVDTLVNNAGDITIQKHFLTTDEAWWDHFLDTNLKSQYMFCRKIAPIMVRNGGGNIINLSSGGATHSHRGMVAYDASKGGVEALTRSLALELAPYKIRVNILVPGLIASKPNHANPAADRMRDETVPLGRGGAPEDLAGPAVFLASADAAYVTGARVVVDGGVLVQQRSPQVDTLRPSDYPAAADII